MMVELNLNRRQFLKLSVLQLQHWLWLSLALMIKKPKRTQKNFKIAKTATPTICPFCGVGCGILVYAKNNTVVYTEGDPDHPINEGNLCSKGTTVRQIYTIRPPCKKTTVPCSRKR